MNKKSIILVNIILVIIILLIGGIWNRKISLVSKSLMNENEVMNQNEVINDFGVVYMMNSIQENIMDVTIYITNNKNIKTVITPDENYININGNKTKFALDYKVDKNQRYTFKIQFEGEDEFIDYILDASQDEKPNILQTNSYAYPLLTLTGVKLNKNITVDYGSGTKNYYSLDNGETWNSYQGSFGISKRSTVLAKTIIDGKITKVDKKDIEFQLANDAMPLSAYDGNNETYPPTPSSTAGIRIDLDTGLAGKKIKIFGRSSSRGYNYYYSWASGAFYDVNGDIINDWFAIWRWGGAGKYYYLIIPQNARQFRFRADHDGYSYNGTIGEISISE